MNKDIALRLALEALESTGENDGYHGVDQYFDNVLVDKAITALRLAIDVENITSKATYKEQLQKKDEPVAWGVFEGNLHDMFFTKEEAQEMAKLKGSHAEIRPLYTKPQREYERGFIDGMQKQMQSSVDKAVNAMTRPTYYIPSKDQREWVGLTDEEKAQFVVAYYPSNWDRKTAVSLMSDYEKYLKEKNHV